MRLKHVIGGIEVIHYSGIDSTISLCGAPVIEDKYIGVSNAEETDEDVTCRHCLEIVRHVRSIIEEG